MGMKSCFDSLAVPESFVRCLRSQLGCYLALLSVSTASLEKPTDYILVYDVYKSLFSGCDEFNQELYGKTFPYQAPNDTNLAE